MVDTDQTPYFVASDLGLQCLLRHVSPRSKEKQDINFWNKYGKNLLVQILRVNTVILMENQTEYFLFLFFHPSTYLLCSRYLVEIILTVKTVQTVT